MTKRVAIFVFAFQFLFTSVSARQNLVQEAWVRHHASRLTDDSIERVSMMRTDPVGNVYVAGVTAEGAEGLNILLIKYDALGNLLWSRSINGVPQASGDDHIIDMYVSNNGQIYLTAKSGVREQGWDMLTVKVSTTGVIEWAAQHNGSGSGDDIPVKIAVDADGSAYVAGNSRADDFRDDVVMIKYGPGGGEQWIERYRPSGSGSPDAEAVSVQIDGERNLLVAATSFESFSSFKRSGYTALKYAPDGALLWTASETERYVGEPYRATAAAVDLQGSFYITGGLGTIKFTKDGEQVWRTIHANSKFRNNTYDVLVDAQRNVFVAASQKMADRPHDEYATIKINPIGLIEWVARHRDSGNFDNLPHNVFLNNETVYVSGRAGLLGYDKNGAQQFLLMKTNISHFILNILSLYL